MDKRIEDLDKEIISLISERSRLYIKGIRGRDRISDGLYNPMDKKEIYDLIKKVNDGPLPSDILKKIYNELISSSVKLIEPLRVACLGPDGTFSHIALLEIFGESIEVIFCNTIPDAFQEVEAGRAEFGVVPVENSSEGAVTYTLDELLETELRIVSEEFLRVSLCFLSPCKEISKIKRIYSHPQPLAQSKKWIKQSLPDAEIHQLNSTTLSAEYASKDKFSAAIASDLTAKIYKLNILAANIEDSRQNYTRFFVIGRKENACTGKDKTSIVCGVKDKPGALYSMLKPFSDAGINMTKIESRPDKKKIWAYNFFIDFIGHKDDTKVKGAIDKLREQAMFLKILGSYPAEMVEGE